jgi:hypothetical protein
MPPSKFHQNTCRDKKPVLAISLSPGLIESAGKTIRVAVFTIYVKADVLKDGANKATKNAARHFFRRRNLKSKLTTPF